MKDKRIGLSTLRILCMVGVILLHSVSNGLRVDFMEPRWQIINIASSFATCSVPLFFMLSGAVILSSKNTYSIEYTLKKRLPRLFIPLFAWSVVYIIISAYMDFYNRGVPIELNNIFNSIKSFFNKESAVHFWFMYYLIPMYLIAPFLKSAIDNSPEKTFKYIINLWLIMITFRTLSKYGFQEIAFIKNIGFISGYGGYFLLGKYLIDRNFEIKKIWLFAIILIVTMFIAKETSHYTKMEGAYNEWFKSYNTITVCALSMCVFLVFKDIKIKRGKKPILYFSTLSYGVYLCHNIFLYLVTELHLGRFSATDMLRNFICVIIISVVLIAILSKIKYINYVFTGTYKK